MIFNADEDADVEELLDEVEIQPALFYDKADLVEVDNIKMKITDSK
jgi:hypothetical protein